MSEKKRKRLVYAIFVLAVIWVIFNIPSAKKHTQYAYDDDYADESDQLAASLLVNDSVSTAISYAGEWGSDPFVWKETHKESKTSKSYNFNLSAISKSNSEYWALVNGKILATGDEIDGWKIIKIAKNRVVLSKNGKTIELTIKGA